MSITETEKHGDDAEYLVCALLQAQGFFVRRSVPFQLSGSGQDATDIDVLGIKISQPFKIERAICDCKDRQRSKPFERIFWTKGLSEFTGANSCYIYLPKASYEISNFAKMGQVVVLTPKTLFETLERISSEPYGIANPSFKNIERVVGSEIKKDEIAAELLYLSQSLFLFEDPYSAISISIDALQKVAVQVATTDRARAVPDLWIYITANFLIGFSLALNAICDDCLSLSQQDRRNHIKNRLTFGQIPPEQAKIIFDFANRLALESAIAANPDLNRDTFNSGSIEPPTFAEDVCGLIELFLQSPETYHSLPQNLERILVQDAIIDRSVLNNETENEFSMQRKAAKNIFSFAKQHARIDISELLRHRKSERMNSLHNQNVQLELDLSKRKQGFEEESKSVGILRVKKQSGKGNRFSIEYKHSSNSIKISKTIIRSHSETLKFLKTLGIPNLKLPTKPNHPMNYSITAQMFTEVVEVGLAPSSIQRSSEKAEERSITNNAIYSEGLSSE